MTTAYEVRDSIVDFLRRELIGPSPGHPAIQVNGEEILRPQDPPRQRYAAGILFPMRLEVPAQEMTGGETPPDGGAEQPATDAIVEHDSQEREVEGAARLELPPETEQEINLANSYLPSAMGLSALVRIPSVLRVRVTAAIYEAEELPWMEQRAPDGTQAYPKGWWRRPITADVNFSDAELRKDRICVLEKPVNGPHCNGLVVHVVSRPYDPADERLRLLTVTLVNRKPGGQTAPRNEDCFFQCGFSVDDPSGSACFLRYPEKPADESDPEELKLQLLYRHRAVFAVGHGCAPEWTETGSGSATTIRTDCLPTYEIAPILPTELPDLQLSMLDLSSDGDALLWICERLADAYQTWIEEIANEAETDASLTRALRETARGHVEDCRRCLSRMRAGIALLSRDENVRRAFVLMNRAMLMQQLHYRISSRQSRSWVQSRSGVLELESSYIQPDYADRTRVWRPFQLAFVLMNLVSIAEPESEERKIVDLIWFPTGGGKTEAYLGLSAFALFHRRLMDPSNAGTSILMRYTLRLLTTQQFQRAASLICACELIRRENTAELGTTPFTIGLWVGGDVTPNTEKDAVVALNQLMNGKGENKFILRSCPWCGAAMGPVTVGQSARIKGYVKLAHPSRVRFRCEDRDCAFSDPTGLPVSVTDEHIYGDPPSLLIGTVDKFAMLPWRPEARSLFGLGTGYSPPDLIIQDELHLISGPLGSMVGLYETAIDALCTRRNNRNDIQAKIIASTATISRAAEQIRSLYAREAYLFPPQGLRVGDSFFAAERRDVPGRLYVGVLATALPSHVTSQVRTMATLLQSVKMADQSATFALDPYWTLMGYFNSLRELGHAATLIRADIREYLNAMWDRLGIRSDFDVEAVQTRRRFINRDIELTSRVSSADVPAILQQLFAEYNGFSHDAIDVCFATNMIQVGLDVPRLSLMTIVGQPKTTSEYIQASSRVGRDQDKPGLVVTNYNPSKPRDRSHFEHFRAYHQSIYRYVEPTSVTPFAVPVRERALHALIFTLARYLDDDLRDVPRPPPSPEIVELIRSVILNRVSHADPEEVGETSAMIDEIIDKWRSGSPPRYGSFGGLSEEIPLMYPAGTQQHPNWLDWPFPTPTSMRNVDSDCEARALIGGYPVLE